MVPLFPSALSAFVAAIDRLALSSRWIVPLAVAVWIVAPLAPLSRTVKASSSSTVVSPETLTVIVFVVSPLAN